MAARGYLTERLEIRCEPDLKEALEELAELKHRSANSLARELLREGIARLKADAGKDTV